MSETQPRSALAEQLQEPELQFRIATRPAVSHVALIALENTFADPTTRSLTDEQKTDWQDATPDALKHAVEAATEVSWESRRKADENDSRTFDERNKEWNQAFWKSVKEFYTDDSVAMQVRGERRMALGALGIDVNTDKKDANGLYTQVEAFRKKYVPEHKKDNDINIFIKDLAASCRGEDGAVDIGKLEERLQAIEPLLAVFGTDKNAGDLVADFAMAQAMLSEKGEAKVTIADNMQAYIQREPSPKEQTRLEALSKKLGNVAGTPEKADETPPDIEHPTPELYRATATARLGRNLTTEEQAILDRGGTAQEVERHARAEVRKRLQDVKPLTEVELANPGIPQEHEDEATALAYSTRELDWMLQEIGITDSQDRQQFVQKQKRLVDVYKAHGADATFGLSQMINSQTGDDQWGPNIKVFTYPEGVDETEFQKQIQPQLKAIQKEQAPPPESPEEAPTEPLPVVNWNEKYKDASGIVYEVISKGEHLPIALRNEKGELFIGKEAADIIKKSTMVEEPQQAPSGKAEDVGEQIKQFGEGMAGAVKATAEGLKKQDENILQTQKRLVRRLGTSEISMITHGANPDEVVEVINYKLDQDSLQAVAQAKKSGEGAVTVRGYYDVYRTLKASNLGITDERIQSALIPYQAAFAKALELKMQPAYHVRFTRRPNGSILPRVDVSILQMPTNPDGSQLSKDDQNLLIQQVVDAQKNATQQSPQ